MNNTDRSKKLNTLPLYALHDIAIKSGIAAKDINGKDKSEIIHVIIINKLLTDEKIEDLVNDYIYGDRVTFTLWTFNKALQQEDYVTLSNLSDCEFYLGDVKGFRNLKILSVKSTGNRVEIVYVYGKEYTYINESGENASVWEQHRGCLWVGEEKTYMACISKHERMTRAVTRIIRELLSNQVIQIKPPKTAIERCTEMRAITRIALQGNNGEKTIVSRAGGITPEQQQEIDRIRDERIDISGSYIGAITEDIEATIKYNQRTGSIGIYKHLSAQELFNWSEYAINVIFEEIENLKGRPVEEIFKEMGQEVKWPLEGDCIKRDLNYYLTHILNALNQSGYSAQIESSKFSILENGKYFYKLPRLYCAECDSYEVPHCAECNRPMVERNTLARVCTCGAPLKLICSEGHDDCEIVNWYIPTPYFIRVANDNIKKIYKDEALNYNFHVLGDMLFINSTEIEPNSTEIAFEDIECFKSDAVAMDQRIRFYAANLGEKCEGSCTHVKVSKCVESKDMVCLPKLFYTVLPSYRPQPHKGMEYGDVSAEVRAFGKPYEFKGIIKKHSKKTSGKNIEKEDVMNALLLSTSKAGEEIIRQFVEQGMNDSRCDIIAVIAPQYMDANLKGSLRFLAKLVNKKVMFITLDEICKLIIMNSMVEPDYEKINA